MSMRYTRPMPDREQIIIKLEKLTDGSIAIRAHSEGTGRVLLDRCYIVKGGFERADIIVTPDGLAFDLT